MISFTNHLNVTIERTPLPPAMRQALANHILKQNLKKREEEEQDAALHRELQKQKIKRQQDHETLEQTNEQIKQLEDKMEQLKKEKHDLFARLKKVLNFEEEQRRRVQQLQFQHAKEANEVLAKVGSQAAQLVIPGASPPMGAGSSGASTPKFLASGTSATTPLSVSTNFGASQTSCKRPRSPSPSTKLAESITSTVVGQHARHPSQGSTSAAPTIIPGFLSPNRQQSSTLGSDTAFSPRLSSFNQQISSSVILSPRACVLNLGTSGGSIRASNQSTASPPPLTAIATTSVITPNLARSIVLPPPPPAPSTSGQATRLPADLRTFNPNLHRAAPLTPTNDMRPVAPQATHLPARIPQHISPMAIPVLPPQQRPVGSITTGYPLQRPPHHLVHSVPVNTLPNRPMSRVSSHPARRPYAYPQYYHPRM
uniref:G protein pathway suppressor 2 n=1 Tax=Romanomermis culicivorax TaxID=13658 RepID=A0A915L1K7_ROMCU